MKYEWKKEEKQYYLPKNSPSLVNIPAFKYFCINGRGNPNDKEFSLLVGALYAVSYAVRMMPKKGITPDGYFEYTVYPLEGLWNLTDEGKNKAYLDKNDLLYTIMIRQPDFVNEEVFKKAIFFAKKKVSSELLDRVYYDIIEDGLSVQILHVGSYDSEPISFDKMKKYINENNLSIKTLIHREIYLSDARKTDKDKLKTILRYRVNK